MKINTGSFNYYAQQPSYAKASDAPNHFQTHLIEEQQRAPIRPLGNPVIPLAPTPAAAETEEAPILSDPSEIKKLLREWKSQFDQRDKSAELEARIENNMDAFEDLIDKAADNGGYHDPETFIRSLSEKELAVLQAMHNLAKPIIPGQLSKESSYNLLLPPNAAQDINKDGTIAVGGMHIRTFPPPHAPQHIRKAWEATIDGLDWKEVALLQAQFKFAKGMGGPAYIPADASYIELTQGALANAEKALRLEMSSPEAEKNRRRTLELLQNFLHHLKSPA